MKSIILDLYDLLKDQRLIFILFVFLIIQISPTLAFYSGLLIIPCLFMRHEVEQNADTLFYIIACYSITYSLFAYINGFFSDAKGNIVFQSVYPLAFYILGRTFTKRSKDLYIVLFLMASLIALSAIVDVIMDIQRYQFINPLRRIERVDGSKSGSATNLGIQVSLAVVCVSLFLSPTSSIKERIYKILFICFSGLGLMCVLHLINRTGLVIAAASTIAVLFFNWNRKNAKYVLLGALMGGIIISYIFTNHGLSTDVAKAYEGREEGRHGKATAGDRVWRWKLGLDDIIDRPFGYPDPNLRKTYSHNFWLDTSGVAGDVPLFFLLIITFLHIRHSSYLIRRLSSGLLRSIIIAFNVGFALTFFVEPVMEGSALYVFLFFMFVGIVRQLSINVKKSQLFYQ